MRKRNLSFLSFILASLVAFPLLASENGSISGQVLEEVGGKNRPAARSVVRLAIYKDGQEIAGAETRADATGRYRFERLTTEGHQHYVVWTERKGVPYRGNFLTFGETNSLTAPDLVVFPVTGDPSGISLHEVVLLEVASGDLAKVTHSLIISNQGALAYDGRAEGGTPIEVGLLPGGFELQNILGLTPENTEVDGANNRLKFNLQIRPGKENDVSLRYLYSYQFQGREIPFNLTTNVARSRFSLAIAGKDLPVEGEGFTEQPSNTLNGKTLYFWERGPLKAGEPVQFTVRGLARPEDFSRLVLLSALALVLFIAVFFALQRPKAMTLEAQRENDRTYFLEGLARLERDFQAGRVSPVEYREEQERLREALFHLYQSQSSSKAA